MARKWFDGVPKPLQIPDDQHPLALGAALVISQLDDHYGQLAFHKAAQDVLQLAISANGYLSEQAPWSAIKKPDQQEQVAQDIYAVLETTRLVGVLLAALLPDLSARLLAQLGLAPCGAWEGQLQWGQLNPGQPLAEPSPILQRLELEDPL